MVRLTRNSVTFAINANYIFINRKNFAKSIINSKILLLFIELDTKTQNLSMLSQKYKKDATYLNRKSMYVKAAAAGIVFVVFILYFWVL